MILIIDRKQTVIRFQSGSLLIEQPNRDRQRVPINQLDQVVIYGNAIVETPVWRALSTENIPATLLPGRSKSGAAVLANGLAVQLPVRRIQHRCANNDGHSLLAAAWFLQRKLQNYALPLSLVREHLTTLSPEVEEFEKQCDDAGKKLEKAESINVMMGLEGAVARAWFALLARYLPFKWRFSGRNRRPPTDPVNALLSLGYTLLHAELRQGLIATGFDPSLGFLHQDYPGRESLALDFAEIFRSGVDYFVLNFILHESIDAHSFYYREEEGCRLSKAARPVFFQAWAQFREDWPDTPPTDIDADKRSTLSISRLALRQGSLFRDYISTLDEDNA